MPGCKYRWLGDAPEEQEPTPTGTELVPATATPKAQTALTLRSVTVLWETFTPGDKPISLSLTYLSKAQILALHIPWEYQKARITVPARHTRILRDGEMCRIHMALEKCQFAIDVSGGGESVWRDSEELKEWVVEEMEVWERDPEKFKADFKGYLEVVCHPVGGKGEEEGSAEKKAHAFFEHIVQHSSGPRSKSLWESRRGGFRSRYHTDTRGGFRKDRPRIAPAIPAPTPARLPLEPARPDTSTNLIGNPAVTANAQKPHSGSYHFARPLGGYGSSNEQQTEAKFSGVTDRRRASIAAVGTTLPINNCAANKTRSLPADPVPGTISGGKPRDFQPRGGFFTLFNRRSEDARNRPEDREGAGSRGLGGRGGRNDRSDRGGRGGRGGRGRGRESFWWLENRPRAAGNN